MRYTKLKNMAALVLAASHFAAADPRDAGHPLLRARRGTEDGLHAPRDVEPRDGRESPQMEFCLDWG